MAEGEVGPRVGRGSLGRASAESAPGAVAVFGRGVSSSGDTWSLAPGRCTEGDTVALQKADSQALPAGDGISLDRGNVGEVGRPRENGFQVAGR